MSTGRKPEHFTPAEVGELLGGKNPAELAAGARNRHPLHTHPAEDPDGPWTAGTLGPHLRVMHGIPGLGSGESLASLAAIHALTEHGRPAPEPVLVTERRRYNAISWGKLRTSDNPEDRDLYLESDNGTTIVCFTPADLIALRAAVLPGDEGLRALQDIWRGNLGPGGGHAVEAGHAAGYSLGVRDMEAVRQDISGTEVVQDWLEARRDLIPEGDSYTGNRDRESLTRVIGFLQQQIDAEREARHVS